jgi:hypothetical protein
MLRFLAWLFKWELIWLKADDNLYLSRKRVNPFGGYYCYANDFMKVGFIELLDDGECQSKYNINQWKPYKEP